MAELSYSHSVEGAAELQMPAEFLQPLAYQSSCVDGFAAKQIAGGFNLITIVIGTDGGIPSKARRKRSLATVPEDRWRHRPT